MKTKIPTRVTRIALTYDRMGARGPKTIFFVIHGGPVWLPLKCITIDSETKTVRMPMWLAAHRKLIKIVNDSRIDGITWQRCAAPPSLKREPPETWTNSDEPY